ncbi:hypothetical protein [Streptomyces sp. ME18-1-4]|uniref:hypothetical protein n=1 Tax=Streptomyces sp. ME18-1-4 TaxID=3028685 RepID=UPI0029BBEBC7|nr:hypothetical protein [Streptomyces sp. ME18-1-4]MDX3246001.1 hypothetical protein [Streptomyces sp. ME18-1-4]
MSQERMARKALGQQGWWDGAGPPPWHLVSGVRRGGVQGARSSTYNRWRRAERDPCERVRRDAELAEQIKEIHADSSGGLRIDARARRTQA